MVRRPGVVTFVAVIVLIQAFLAFVEGIVLLAFRDDVQDALTDYGDTLSDGVLTSSGIGVLIGGLLLLLVGFGLLRGSRGWRLFTVIVVTLRMAFAIYEMLIHPHGAILVSGGFTLLIGAFVIWALYGHKESEDYFEGQP